MSGAVSIAADAAYPAGHAVIRIAGAAGFAGPFGYRIRRDEFDENHFGPKGWQVADALLTPDERSTDGNDLLLHIGSPVVQHVTSGVYHFALPAAGIETLVVWPDLPLLSAAAMNMVAEPARVARAGPAPARPQIQRRAPSELPSQGEPGVRTAPQPADGETPDDDATVRQTVRSEQPPQEPTPKPVVPGPDVPVRRNAWLLWLLLALIVLGAGGGYGAWRYWYASEPVEAGRQPPPNHEAAAPPGGAPGSGTPQGTSGQDVEHMSGIDLARSHAAPDVLLREAERRMQLGGTHRNDALLLMQVAADRGYAPAHAALGRFYDPDLPHPADIHPDEHEAALQYHAAVAGGDNSVADGRAALKTHLEQRAQQGDVFAPQILKDFWQ